MILGTVGRLRLLPLDLVETWSQMVGGCLLPEGGESSSFRKRAADWDFPQVPQLPFPRPQTGEPSGHCNRKILHVEFQLCARGCPCVLEPVMTYDLLPWIAAQAQLREARRTEPDQGVLKGAELRAMILTRARSDVCGIASQERVTNVGGERIVAMANDPFADPV